MPRAMRMRRIMLLIVACLAQSHFPTLSHKRQDLKKNYCTQNVCFDFLYSFSLKCISFYEVLSYILS